MSRPSSLHFDPAAPSYAIAPTEDGDAEASWAGVERWLREAAHQGDLRAALTLVVRARPDWRGDFQAWEAHGGELGVYGLCGLLRLGEPVADRLRRAMGEAAGWPARVAAETLAEFAPEEAAEGLFAQLSSPAVQLRSAALDALRGRVALPSDWTATRQTPFEVLALRLLVELQCVYPEAAARITAVLQGLASGEAADTLLPAYAPSAPGLLQAFGANMPHGQPWKVGGFVDLSEHDRAWVAAAALLRVGLLDAFAAEALGALGLTSALPALHEVHARLVPTDKTKARRFERVIARLERAAG